MFVKSWQQFIRTTSCFLSLALLIGPVRAADEPAGELTPEQKLADQRVYSSLREIINHGADLYNSGDRNGCYRLFEGALMAVRPQLGHHPEAQKIIDGGITGSEQYGSIGQRAFALRGVLAEVRAKIRPGSAPSAAVPPSPPPAPPPAEPPVAVPAPAPTTLWDRLGGDKGVAKVVDEFIDAARNDPKVNLDRGGKFKLDDKNIAALKKHTIAFMSQVTGGNVKYSGKNMKVVHKGMGITDEEFDAAADLLRKALTENNAKPEDVDEVMKLVGSTRKDIVEEKKPDEPKPEEKKPEDKKPDAIQPDDKKPDAPKPDEKKPEEKKPDAIQPDDKKPDAPKPDEKKPEDKKPDAIQPDDKKPDAPKPDEKKPEDKTPDNPQAADAGKVSGALTLNGKPLGIVEVRLVPKDNLKEKGIAASTSAEGNYELSGVKPGEYVVLIKTLDKSVLLPAMYSVPEQSPLTVKVDKGDTSKNIELTIEEIIKKPTENKPDE